MSPMKTIDHQILGENIGVHGGLDISLLADGRRAILNEPFSVKVREHDLLITVPEAFMTDFASIPRLFWTILPPWGKYSPAAVVHDFLYWSKMVRRKEADQVFLILMQRLGVATWKRRIMYRAVRIFGGFRYGKNNKKREDKGVAPNVLRAVKEG